MMAVGHNQHGRRVSLMCATGPAGYALSYRGVPGPVAHISDTRHPFILVGAYTSAHWARPGSGRRYPSLLGFVPQARGQQGHAVGEFSLRLQLFVALRQVQGSLQGLYSLLGVPELEQGYALGQGVLGRLGG